MLEEHVKKTRKRSSAPNRSSEKQIRDFVEKLIAECPMLLGNGISHPGYKTPAADTLLARVAMNVGYIPSIKVCCNPKWLKDHGYLTGEGEINGEVATLRVIAQQASAPMLREIQEIAFRKEAALIAREMKKDVDVEAGQGAAVTAASELMESWGSW